MRLAAVLGAALVATVLFGWGVGFALEVLSGSSGALVDGPVAEELTDRRSAATTGAMRIVTWLGNRGVVLAAMALLSGAIWALVKDKGPALFLVASVIGGYAASHVVKDLVHRVRPAEGLVHASGGSFPSGHAVASVTLYGGLALVVWRMSAARGSGGARQRRLLRFAACVVATVLVIAIALSRVYLGVHWASDVVGGVLLGGVWLTVCWLTWSRWDRLRL